MGDEYGPPTLVLFRGSVDSACGLTSSAAGPFYCAPDDRLQQQSRRRLSPESFTHGSSAKRVRRFRSRLDSGDVNQCNTSETARR